MTTPKEYRYTEEHEWVCPQSRNEGKIGITDYAQSRLGDIVFVELSAVGTKVEQADKVGEIESIKAVSELYSPVSGEVLALNQAVIDAPQTIKEDPYGEGWLMRVKLSDPSQLDRLMDSQQYDAFVAGLDE